MKRSFFYIFAFVATLFSANVFATGNGTDSAFVPMAVLPNEYFPIFSADNQMSLINKVKSGSDSCAKGSFGKDVCIEVLSDDFLQYKTSELGRLTIKKFKRSADGLEFIAVVNSVKAPVEDSQIRFLDCSFRSNKPFSVKVLEPVVLEDFIDKDSMVAKGWSADDVRNKMDMLFLSYKLDPKSNDIVVTLNNKEFLAKEDYEKLRPVLKSEALTLKWNGNSFDKK